MTDLNRLAALAAAATPGPWEIDIEHERGDYGSIVSTYLAGVRSGDRRVVEFRDDYGTDQNADAAFIAACDPATIQELVAAVRERDELREALIGLLGGVELYIEVRGQPDGVFDFREVVATARTALHHGDGA